MVQHIQKHFLVVYIYYVLVPVHDNFPGFACWGDFISEQTSE